MNNFTIKQIAQMAGVSPTAVSFVLNGKEGVSKITRKKVLDIINFTGYVPDRNSIRLSSKKSFNICLAMSRTSSMFADLFYYEITKGIIEGSEKFGYNVIISMLKKNSNGNYQLPSSILNKDADGIIFLQDTQDLLLEKIEELNIPFVLVDAHNPKDKYTCVNTDCMQSAFVATQYLINNGHKQIAFIGSSYIANYYAQTLEGFTKAMSKNNLYIEPNWLESSVKDEQTAYLAMKNILFHKRPTAVFCAGDIYAIGAIKCVWENNLTVPEDISFIGIDDILLSSHITPPLTTINYDKAQMGKLAFELIIKKINKEPANTIVLKSDNLIIRNSVATINI